MKCRKENPGSDRNSDDVVDKSEEQILPDVSHGCHAQMARSQDRPEIPFEQRDPTRLHRNVCAGSHRDPDVCCG